MKQREKLHIKYFILSIMNIFFVFKKCYNNDTFTKNMILNKWMVINFSILFLVF